MSLNKRGTALGVVLMASIVFTVSAFAVLTIGMSSNQRTELLYGDRIKARYAAEAGVVWTMQKLWQDPTWFSNAGYTGSPGDPPELDTDGDGKADTKVDVILPKCTKTPCEARKLQARVIYP